MGCLQKLQSVNKTYVEFSSPVGDTALLTAGLAGQLQGAGAVVSHVQGEQGQVSGVVRVDTNRQELRFNYSAEVDLTLSVKC